MPVFLKKKQSNLILNSPVALYCTKFPSQTIPWDNNSYWKKNTFSHLTQPMVWIIIRLEVMLRPNIGFTLLGDLAVFTRSAKTPPKVNRFGWNLEHSAYNVRGLSWQILGAICAVATVWKADQFLFFCPLNNARFRHFRRPNFTKFEHKNVDRFRDGNFLNRILKILPLGVVFPKNTKIYHKIVTSCDLYKAAITPQWLQIAGNSLTNNPFAVCLVSIFTVRINSKSFAIFPLRYKLRTRTVPTQIFGNVRHWVKHVRRCAAWLTDIKEKQTKLETENK